MVVLSRGPAHRVEVVTLLDALAWTDNALTTGIPEIGMVEAEVVAQLCAATPVLKQVNRVVQPRWQLR